MEYEVTYQMSQRMFNAIAATAKNKKVDKQKYVNEIVEDTFGLRGKCIKVVVKG